MLSSVYNWKDYSPSEVLASHELFTMEQVAFVLGLLMSRGEKAGSPDRRRARILVREGKLRLVDPDQPVMYWTVSAAELRRYRDGKPIPRMAAIDSPDEQA